MCTMQMAISCMVTKLMLESLKSKQECSQSSKRSTYRANAVERVDNSPSAVKKRIVENKTRERPPKQTGDPIAGKEREF